MKILHVVAGLPHEGGGLAEFVPMLAAEAAREEHSVVIALVAQQASELSEAASRAAASGVSLVRFRPSWPSAAFFSWDMVRGLAALVRDADVVHVHSAWTFPVWWASRNAVALGRPFVISPHGALDPVRLRHSAFKKAAVAFLDRWCLRHASAIHVTSSAEGDWVRRYLAPRPCPPVAVIPGGIRLPKAGRPARPPCSARRMLYLGRLHPLKGLPTLVEAWQRVQPPGWQLMIAGPDSHGVRGALERQIRQLGLPAAADPAACGIRLSGPLYGADKDAALAAADVVVLPSLSENFGLVVAESLAAGTPVITTTATPWSQIAARCGWCVTADVDSIAGAISAATAMTDKQRRLLGNEGRLMVESDYTWPVVGRRMLGLYSDLTANCP